MISRNGPFEGVLGGRFHLISPWFHRVRVKRGDSEKAYKNRRISLFLFSFPRFTPTHPRDAKSCRNRVCARGGGGEKVKPGLEVILGFVMNSATYCRHTGYFMVPSRSSLGKLRHMGSRLLKESLFALSEVAKPYGTATYDARKSRPDKSRETRATVRHVRVCGAIGTGLDVWYGIGLRRFLGDFLGDIEVCENGGVNNE